MKNNYIFLFMIILLSSVSAEVQVYPQNGVQDKCINLAQTEKGSAYQTLTAIQYPNQSVLLVGVNMTKYFDYYFYTFCNITQSGAYLINTCSDLSCNAYTIKISGDGQELTLPQTIVYLFFLLFCLSITWYSFRIFKNNKMAKDITNKEMYEVKKRNEFLFYIQMIKKKLWILGLFGMYLSIFLFTALLNQLTFTIGLYQISSFLQNVNIIIGYGIIPFVLFWIGFFIINFFVSIKDIMKYEFGNDVWRGKNERN